MTDRATEELEIRSFEGEAAEWDDFVATSDHGTFCHLIGWREVMADALGHESLLYTAQDRDGTIVGALPLVRVKSRIFGDYLVSMPFLNYGGPIGSPAAQSRLAEHAVEAAKRLGVDLVELRTRHPVETDLSLSERKITVLLDLPPDEEVLWKEVFPAKLRSQIRRPIKENMEGRFGLDQVEAFYSVFTRNMRDLGTPVLPLSFFERIASVLAERAVFGAVYWREQPVAAAAGFIWRDEFEMTWASSLREHNRMAPNMLLYWTFMQQMIARGLKVFNFGRCSPDSGTHRFKRQWGGNDAQLSWAQWSPSGVSATPSPDRPIFRAATAAWSRLPLGLANRIGPFLSRNIP
jgi:FemAB-related protein (PEP-CTERM system-associated)